MKPPGSKSHLEKLITQWSKSEPTLSEYRLRRTIAVSVFASILEDVNKTGDEIIIKGGTAMEIRFGFDSRVTRDIDASTPHSVQTGFDLISKSMKQGWKGFTGKLTPPREMNIPNTNPVPQQCKIQLEYKNKPFMSIPFELSQMDEETAQLLEEIENRIDITPAQLEAVNRVLVLGVPAQIAQKIHACTKVVNETNGRVHDLYDIAMLEPLVIDDIDKLKKACQQVFEKRATHSWPPKLKEWEHWPTLWEQIDISEHNRIDYHQARQTVLNLIEEAAC